MPGVVVTILGMTTRTVALALLLLAACDQDDAGEPDSTSSTSGLIETADSSSGSTGEAEGSTGNGIWYPDPGQTFAACTKDEDCEKGGCIVALDTVLHATRGQCSVSCNLGDLYNTCALYGPENQAAVGCVDLYPEVETNEWPPPEPVEEPKLNRVCLMSCPSFQVECAPGFECRTVELGKIVTEACLPLGV